MPEPHTGRLIGQRWRLGRRLSQGDHSSVYSAIGSDGVAVAVKLLVPAARFTKELLSRAAEQNWVPNRVTHPGVPRVLEHHLSDPQQPYIVSELLDGETLAQRTGREPGLPEAELLELGEGVAGILAYLHSQGIAHGELSAEHVFLCRGGGVKLLGLDLPSAWHPRACGSVPDAVGASGAMAELAPEQASGQWDGVDGRADLFALGALLFAALAGRRVHEASDPAARAELMRRRAASPLASVAPMVPASICAVVDTALAFSLGARYPDAAIFGLDLRAVRNGLAPPFAAARLHATIQAMPAGKLSDRVQQSIRARVRESTAPDADAVDALVGTVLAGRFRIERHLGSGAMGSVYLARHIHIRQPVAIKVLHREMSCEPEVVARFEREAIAAARIEHPHVAAARDFGRLEDGSFYLVLEYVQGESLRALLNREGPRSVTFSLAIARQIASALEAAHAAGVVHRDLKPENVMLRPGTEGQDDSIKVLDFGIAKVNAELGEPALTRAGMVFGTPEYMSPEQASGQPVDCRTDLYALGILLYEMLSGSTPFSRDNVVAVLGAQLTAPPPELPATIPPAVRQLVSRLLVKSPDERVQSATELIAALDSAAAACASPVAAAGPFLGAARGGSRAALRVASRAIVRHLGSARRLGASLVTRRVTWHARTVPLWLPVAAGAASLLCLALLWPEREPRASGRQRTALFSAGKDRPGDALVARAAQGDPDALAELRASSELGQREWRAIGTGYAHEQSWDRSVEAYARLLDLDPAASSDPQLVSAVYRALRDPKSARTALDLAERLGSVGADLLYDTYSQMRSGRASSDRELGLEARRRLDATAVRSRASRALGVALELAQARTCRDFQRLMAPAVAHGDTRSLPALRRLARRSGCGFLRLSDCYSCLRHDTGLSEAIEATSRRPGPTYVSDSQLPP